jgi:hypothetical protein
VTLTTRASTVSARDVPTNARQQAIVSFQNVPQAFTPKEWTSPTGLRPFAGCSEVIPFPDVVITFLDTVIGLGLAP